MAATRSISSIITSSNIKYFSTSTLLSPAASFIINSNSYDVKSIIGTGKKGMILKSDIINSILNGTIKTTSTTSSVCVFNYMLT